ncbi:PiggyBac transposable element-derived protein 4 [Orchesella cincta]|uniref:PiggyBac transposable element-derived protein 4 n=1 Tax=Orchesella cincta TaxID=48709 RepID=A0A1D2M5T2_ORCCI|nr:PiggyBac transposable element-derived protein 4 [Orchesella cincta]
MSERIRKGEVRYHSCNGILVERWKDKKEIPMIDFKERLVRQIISTVGEHSTTKGRKATVSLESSKRLTERHFPVQVPVTGKTKYPTKECAVCRKKNGKGKTGRSQTRYMCAECNVGLCVDGCFRTYHTVKRF